MYQAIRYAIFLFLIIIHTTKGIPISEVTALIGIALSLPGRFEIISLARSVIAPVRIHPGIRILWFVVLKTNLTIWGTAIPINPSGPQKAVTLPARMLVERNIKKRERLICTPMLCA